MRSRDSESSGHRSRRCCADEKPRSLVSRRCSIFFLARNRRVPVSKNTNGSDESSEDRCGFLLIGTTRRRSFVSIFDIRYSVLVLVAESSRRRARERRLTANSTGIEDCRPNRHSRVQMAPSPKTGSRRTILLRLRYSYRTGHMQSGAVF